MDLGLQMLLVCMFLLILLISINNINSGRTHQGVILVDSSIIMDQQGASLLAPCSHHGIILVDNRMDQQEALMLAPCSKQYLDLWEVSSQVQAFLDRMEAVCPEQYSNSKA